MAWVCDLFSSWNQSLSRILRDVIKAETAHGVSFPCDKKLRQWLSHLGQVEMSLTLFKLSHVAFRSLFIVFRYLKRYRKRSDNVHLLPWQSVTERSLMKRRYQRTLLNRGICDAHVAAKRQHAWEKRAMRRISYEWRREASLPLKRHSAQLENFVHGFSFKN